MIERVGTVTIFVRNQEAAKAFYTDALDMELRHEGNMPASDAKWIEIAPPGAETAIVLYLMDEHWQHYREIMGRSQAITLQVNDMEETAATLRARGVTIVQEPQQEPWGQYMIIADPEGNSIILTAETLAMQDG